MGTFANWLEDKKHGLYENNIDDHKLVDMLNETYRQNRKLINRLAESKDFSEIKGQLRQLSPEVLLKVEGLGKQAMLAALLGLGGVGAKVGSDYLAAKHKSDALAGPHAAAVKGLQGMERRGNLADRDAIDDLNRLGRAEVAKMQSDAAVERNDDDRMDSIAQHGGSGLGFGYTDSGRIEPRQYTPAEQWQIMKDMAKAAREREAEEARRNKARDDEYRQYRADQERKNDDLQRARDTRVKVGDDGKITVRNPLGR